MKRKLVLFVVLLVFIGITISLVQANQVSILEEGIGPQDQGDQLMEVYETIIKNSDLSQEIKEIAMDPVNQTLGYERLFDNANVHHFKIVISKEEWDGLSSDMLAYLPVDDRMRTGVYRKADLYYSDEYGDIKLQEIGIRSKGNTTRRLPEDESGFHRFNFKLKFNETFDLVEGTQPYNTRDNRLFSGLSELNFKTNYGTDHSNMKEIFCYDLLNDFGLMTSQASMATLTFVVDGVEHDYGIARMIEPIDKEFLTKKYGKDLDDGNLYKCLWQNPSGPATLQPIEIDSVIGVKDWVINYRPTYDLKTNEDERNYQDLLSFIDNINTLEGDAFKVYLEEHFEVDRFIRYQAMNVVVGCLDDYWCMGNNYYLYFTETGKLEWMPFDYDNVMGTGWCGEPVWSAEGIANADIYEWKNINKEWFSPTSTHPLIEKILAIDTYKATYEAYISELIDPDNHYFTYERFLEEYELLYGIYSRYVENEMHEGDEWYLSTEEWFFETKLKSLNSQLNKERE